MPILETLYSPTRKDRLQGLAQRRWLGRLNAGAVATLVITPTLQLPPDVAVLIKQVTFEQIPFTGTTMPYDAILYHIDETGTAIGCVASWTWMDQNFSSQNDSPNTVTILTDYVLLAQETIRCEARFSGAAGSNQITAYCSGIEIPRGNIQR